MIRLSPVTLNKSFIEKVEKLSAQHIHRCFQCGICSGSCPMTDSMDILPRKILRMAQLGLEEKLENLKTYWVCASCQACNVMCPRGVDLTRVMEALRLMTLRKSINYIEPSQIPADTLKECPQIALVAAFRKLTG